MGYDFDRFVNQVDEEFICPICTLVIENPVQSPCDHLFCKKCIKNWLHHNKTCPHDERPLTLDDLKDPNRVLRNLLNKLEIKCDFDGCETVTKLENLEQHVSKCVYNLNGEVVCDKGCCMTMIRREYQDYDCISHLSKEVTKLRHELKEQKSFLERTVEELKSSLESRVDRQNEEMKRFFDQLNRFVEHSELE